MVKNSIKVCARLKCENYEKKNSMPYEISRKTSHEDIVLDYNNSNDKKQKHKFRFHKIFDKNASQEEVFDVIAKPVVNSVINGYNGTIFAYGQTGSGKTYSITGSPTNYNNRGLIPRSIQQIFEFINSSLEKYFVHISYLEIYNEIAYDLLNPKQQATSLEELPRVALLEDGKGEAHLRNLSVLPASSEQEAMRLLFLGDTNRTIAETPMNEYSSRSHCIFTIYISFRNVQEGKVRKSKLHLVDLAGSERVHKTNLSGVTLTEAKHINLSLHYLQMVIQALSQTKKQPHIPYRNSIMTYLLKDSLFGNSLTVMLTTISTCSKNILETLSTCKFAQRVALINTEAVINEESDPQQEINLLKTEVLELRNQLVALNGLNVSQKITSKQREQCKKWVQNFLSNENFKIPIAEKLPQVKFCFELLKSACKKKNSNGNTDSDEDSSILDEEVHKSQSETSNMQTTISSSSNGDYTDKLENTQPDNQDHYINILDRYSSPNLKKLLENEDVEAFEIYLSSENNRVELQSYHKMLEKKYECAKIVANTIEECQQNIVKIRKQLEQLHTDCRNLQNVDDLNCQLIFYQNIYRETMLQLKTLKNEIEHLTHGLKQVEIKLVQKFKIKCKQNTSRSICNKRFDESVFNVLDRIEKENTLNIPEFDQSAFNPDFLQKSVASANNNSLLTERDKYICDILRSSKPNPYAYPSKSHGLRNHFMPSERVSISSKSKNLKQKKTKSPKGITISDDMYRIDKNISCVPALHENPNKSSCSMHSSVAESNTSLDVEFLDNYKFSLENNNKCQSSIPVKETNDSEEFLEFMKTVPLTGDPDVDDEIYSFYRAKFNK